MSSEPVDVPISADLDSTASSSSSTQTEKRPPAAATPRSIGIGSLAVAPPVSPVRVRGWSDRLVHETGVSFAAGFVVGSFSGLYLGATKELPVNHPTIRWNTILNNVGRSSYQTANSYAVFGLTYSISRSIIRGQLIASEDSLIPEAGGVAVASAISLSGKYPRPTGFAAAAALGAVMYGGLYLKKTYADEMGYGFPSF